jgi:hypothetical protein
VSSLIDLFPFVPCSRRTLTMRTYDEVQQRKLCAILDRRKEIYVEWRCERAFRTIVPTSISTCTVHRKRLANGKHDGDTYLTTEVTMLPVGSLD